MQPMSRDQTYPLLARCLKGQGATVIIGRRIDFRALRLKPFADAQRPCPRSGDRPS
jgi:hypothetical protein